MTTTCRTDCRCSLCDHPITRGQGVSTLKGADVKAFRRLIMRIAYAKFGGNFDIHFFPKLLSSFLPQLAPELIGSQGCPNCCQFSSVITRSGRTSSAPQLLADEHFMKGNYDQYDRGYDRGKFYTRSEYLGENNLGNFIADDSEEEVVVSESEEEEYAYSDESDYEDSDSWSGED